MMIGQRAVRRLVLGGALAFSVFGYAQQNVTTSELIQQPGYLSTWQKMVKGQKNLPNWARRGEGTSVPAENMHWQGKEYRVGNICKPHDCANNFLVVAFSANKKQSWGVRVIVADKPKALESPSKSATYQWLGKPDDGIKALLMRYIESDPNWK